MVSACVDGAAVDGLTVEGTTLVMEVVVGMMVKVDCLDTSAISVILTISVIL